MLLGGAIGSALGSRLRGRVRQKHKGRSSDFAVTAARRLVAPGLVDAHSVRIWLRTDRPGWHTLTLTSPDGLSETRRFEVRDDPATDGTHVVRWPDDVGAAPLRPGVRYGFDVRHTDGENVGSGRFVTAPLGPDDAHDEFSIAIASCHQPFEEDGTVRHSSLGLLHSLETSFEAFNVEQLLLLGDQMYTDLPKHHALFGNSFKRVAPPGRETVLDCTRAEVRALLQERYRIFWKIAPFARLQANYATLCMLDDHEVVDNFGSAPKHASPEWANYRAGAIDAFHDYQALRAHDRTPKPTTFAARFARGPVAGLILDLRTERVADDDHIRILGEDQWMLLDRFLVSEGRRPVLLLGLSVPILHAPDWLIETAGHLVPKGGDVSDRWSHPHARPDLDRLLERLRLHREAFPAQKVILLGGDIHVGVVSQLAIGDTGPIFQFVSSAVSNLEKRINRLASGELPMITRGTTTESGLACSFSLVPGVDGRDENPTDALNAGVLTLRRSGDEWMVRMRIVGHEPGEPLRARVVYDSGEH